MSNEAAQVKSTELRLFQLAVVWVDGEVVGGREIAIGEVCASECGSLQIAIREF